MTSSTTRHALSRRQLRVGDLQFDVLIAGEGPLVVLLHGFPESSRSWHAQIQALAEAGYTAVAPDLRGWSRNPHVGGAYSCALPGHAAAREVLARPFDDRLFFAGEATHRFDLSTAHGAHDTGVRAAEQAIACLRRSTEAVVGRFLVTDASANAERFRVIPHVFV
jgi:monoamine oxidase